MRGAGTAVSLRMFIHARFVIGFGLLALVFLGVGFKGLVDAAPARELLPTFGVAALAIAGMLWAVGAFRRTSRRRFF